MTQHIEEVYYRLFERVEDSMYPYTNKEVWGYIHKHFIGGMRFMDQVKSSDSVL